MNPCIIIDIETTGLPNKPRGWSPGVVEIGAVVVTSDGQLADTFDALVQQPPEHLTDHRAAFALGLADLTPELITQKGRDADRIAIRFACWLGAMAERHGARHLQAFNQSFDFGFLTRSPWSVQATGLSQGEDIMTAAQSIMGPAGALPQWASGEYKWPRSSEAAEFFGVEHQGTVHRALPDAQTEALIWIEINNRRNA
jgi:DNA polymerase III epsilon subunit-like protein